MQLDELKKEVDNYLYHDPAKKRVIDAAFEEFREKQAELPSETMNVLLKLNDLWEAKVVQYTANLSYALNNTQKDLAQKNHLEENTLGITRATPTKPRKKIKTAHAYQEAKKENFQQGLNQLAQKISTKNVQQESKVKEERHKKQAQKKEEDISTKRKLK